MEQRKLTKRETIDHKFAGAEHEFTGCLPPENHAMSNLAIKPTATPLQRAMIRLLTPLLEDEVGSIEREHSRYVTPSGRVRIHFTVDEAPRDWFLDADGFEATIRDASQSLDWPKDLANPPSERPFANPETLLTLTDREDGDTYISAVGNLDAGWVLIAEASIGEYTDDNTDAHATLSLYLGTPKQLHAVLRNQAVQVVENACRMVVDAIDAVPERYRSAVEAARQAYPF